ncbi:S1/P1 Nuclease [Phlyctema vagabunda]|uniref:S1/P1 Nuclease n=1 Tax=Phlyctema vagabunda TaxID=108571 RepID=A0ABR4PE30_9HELO
MRLSSTLLTLVPAACFTTAWNTDVHNQIGFMAEKFLTPETTSIVQKILTEPVYNGSIGRAAAWADGYRRLPEGAYTYQWHWIDSDDQPPAVCNTYYNRDCAKGGCIVSAIANQSQILRDCIGAAKSRIYSNTTAGDLTCSNALKFLVHFTSDLAQPLHTSYLGEGGNAFNVSWGGRTNNSVLHSIWDGAIIYTRANKTAFSNQTIDPFFAALTARITRDDFFTPTDDWTTCTDPATPVKCAMQWAEDSNRWNCDYVYSQDFSAPDLRTSGYFEGAYPIVEIQTSKAALRLGSYLNRLVAGDYDEKREVVLRTNPAWREWRKDEL